MDPTGKPIGYWLKHLHNLIEAQLDAVRTELGLGRRHWQTLNLLSEAARTRPEIDRALAPFWQDSAVDLPTLLDGPDGMLARGWVSETPEGSLALTEAGRTAHAAVAARVGAVRGQLLEGLSPQQYVETVRILSVMAGNLEAALAVRQR